MKALSHLSNSAGDEQQYDSCGCSQCSKPCPVFLPCHCCYISNQWSNLVDFTSKSGVMACAHVFVSVLAATSQGQLYYLLSGCHTGHSHSNHRLSLFCMSQALSILLMSSSVFEKKKKRDTADLVLKKQG